MRWFLLGAAILLISLTAAAVYGYRYLHVPSHTVTKPVEFIVAHGDSLAVVAENLVTQGVLDSAWPFEWLARIQNQGDQIKRGEYQFEGAVSPRSVLDKLVRGSVITYSVQLKEGVRLEKYLAVLRSKPKLENDIEGITPKNIIERLQLRIEETHGEGLFFPETYQYRAGETASSILQRAFDLMQNELNVVWLHASKDIRIESKYELLIVASLIERESHIMEDRARISGVIHRRLGLGMLLQIDPSILYALGDDFDGRLRRRHLRIDSPYNTYRVKGLPPSPICAPSRGALRAAANPAPGKALYFVSRGDGSSQFSETLSEHNQAVARYITNRSSP